MEKREKRRDRADRWADQIEKQTGDRPDDLTAWEQVGPEADKEALDQTIRGRKLNDDFGFDRQPFRKDFEESKKPAQKEADLQFDERDDDTDPR